MVIGARIRQLRESKSLSQGDIEKRTGLLRCYLSRVENGHTVPSIETIEKLAGAFEIPLYRFFYEGMGAPRISKPTGHSGTVKLNDTYFNTAKYNTPAWRNLVSCQEVGHNLGLDHQDETFDNPNLGTCMDYTNDPSTNQHPNNHDYDQLADIYAHLDSTTTVGAVLPTSAPGAFQDLDVDGPGQWGRLVKTTRDGRSQTYELDFGHGNKVITHVLWSDDAVGRRGR